MCIWMMHVLIRMKMIDDAHDVCMERIDGHVCVYGEYR